MGTKDTTISYPKRTTTDALLKELKNKFKQNKLCILEIENKMWNNYLKWYLIDPAVAKMRKHSLQAHAEVRKKFLCDHWESDTLPPPTKWDSDGIPHCFKPADKRRRLEASCLEPSDSPVLEGFLMPLFLFVF